MPPAPVPDAGDTGSAQSGADSPVLAAPREGTPAVISQTRQLTTAADRLAAGHGPWALDAERASGYRYGQRAYLVQLRRAGAGTTLIDPVACPDLSEIDQAMSTDEVVLHAAHQDLPCLAELGLRPNALFDTELAGRLLGYQRVGLASMTEHLLGVGLAKEHSAADWSARPLPEDWLRYAALDVELLVELRDALEAELRAAGKLDWAREEFAAVLAAPPRPPRSDPWRRTSGIHKVRSQRGLAAVRELWNERDRIARDRDLSPGRVLPDAGIVAAASQMPTSPGQLAAMKHFTTRGARRHLSTWFAAVRRARTMASTELPQPNPPGDGPPAGNRWAERDPQAAGRLTAARGVVSAVAEEVCMPAENVVQPDAVRRLAWDPPQPVDPETVAAQLRQHQVRRWQRELCATRLAAALREAEQQG
ncbi:ribonuclease D [Lipingzhangella sp. LS1_29]|uniref:Ribonuclease D n=1 Tax=Lipingzhangella rawalii TaxID=2055835 RepID=A0ABU2H0N0_9ACTN|nr:ribonuclease D [Lipingzhangella rawalii]MDS1268859.1 ribonuclease D [Lipingzhangella rawalii]